VEWVVVKEAEKGGEYMRAYLFIALIIAILTGVFIFQNTAMVEVHFLNWVSPEISLALVILLALCSGALLTFLLDSVRYFQIASKIRELTVSNKKLQTENDRLKRQQKDEENKKGDVMADGRE
jgi:uncharacterized integral membrane protein